MRKRNSVPKTEEGFSLQFRSRPTKPVSIKIPNDVMASLEKIASRRDMSLEALVKFYVGLGLRQDLTEEFSERVLEKTDNL